MRVRERACPSGWGSCVHARLFLGVSQCLPQKQTGTLPRLHSRFVFKLAPWEPTAGNCSLPPAPTWVSGEVPHEEVAERIFSPRHPGGLGDCELAVPSPTPSHQRVTRPLRRPPPAGRGAEESPLPSRFQGPPLEGARSPEGFLFPEAPPGGEGAARVPREPKPQALQGFEQGSCSLGWHVSA